MKSWIDYVLFILIGVIPVLVMILMTINDFTSPRKEKRGVLQFSPMTQKLMEEITIENAKNEMEEVIAKAKKDKEQA